MEAIIYILLFIFIAWLIMIGTNILYNIAAVFMPIIAIIMVIVGVIVGFIVAIKNTFSVYKRIYLKKGN